MKASALASGKERLGGGVGLRGAAVLHGGEGSEGRGRRRGPAFGLRFRFGRGEPWLPGDLAQEALARGRRGRLDVSSHGIGDEITLQFGDFAAAEIAGIDMLLCLAHAVFRQKLEREKYEVVIGNVAVDHR
ncbi:MAG TPA: hypothetical protein VFA99_16875 [Acidobacteriaceae bacterium]|nr:hypothetical protein [Acidobacteriaceae bacterium]